MTTKRRWYQFSLRTMFVLTVVVSIPLAWVRYSLDWIRQRHEATANVIYIPEQHSYIIPPDAPGGLRLFGEVGVVEISCYRKDADLVTRLFPEVQVYPHDPHMDYLKAVGLIKK